jgi:hypothetical protein
MIALTCAMMTFELLQTVTLSLQVFASNAFFVVSISLLGLGFGGTLGTVGLARIALAPVKWLWACALAFGVAVPVSMLAVCRTYDPVWLIVTSLPPFVCVGLFLAVTFTTWPRRANPLYFADLLGSALGCVVLVAVLDALGDAAATIMLVAILGSLASMPLALKLGRRHLAGSIATTLVLASLLPVAQTLFPFNPHPSKHHGLLRSSGAESKVSWSRWGYLGRLDIVDVGRYIDKFAHGGAHAHWLMSQGAEYRYLFASGDNWSYAVDFKAADDARKKVKNSDKCSAYLVGKADRSLVIGVGGGTDLFCARAHGAKSVTAAEINPLMVTAMRSLGKTFWDGAFFDERIQLHEVDGRTLAQTTDDKFDVVTLTAVDTGAGLAHGGFVVSESYLYTRDAFEEYFSLLREGGVIYVMRPTAQLMRVIATAVAAMRTRGVGTPEQHVVVIGGGKWESAIFFREPATRAQVDTLIARFGKNVRYEPFSRRDNVYDQYLTAVGNEADGPWLAAAAVDYSATTDDQPFFYQQARIFRTSYAGTLLFRILLWVVIFSVLLLFVPLLRFRTRVNRGETSALLLYFLSIGGGFIMIEICLIQKLSLYLGHPAYSVSVTLFAMLLFSGLGSLTASKIRGEQALRLVLPAIALFGVAYALALGPLLRAVTFEALAPRVLVALALVAPGSFIMGMPFPMALRSISEAGRPLIPWVWAVNAFASVVGSVGAMILAMCFGFRTVLLSGAALYLLAALAHLLRSRQRAPELSQG